MATPLTADEIVALFKEWDIPFREHTIGGVSWRNHNRDAVGAFGPVNGFMNHHTADDAPDTLDLQVCWKGRPPGPSYLPGPLVQFGLDDGGTVDLIGHGRCNHAGGGDPHVLTAVVDEKYGDYPPPTHYHEGSAGATDGNTHFYGMEIYYSGGHPMTTAARTTQIKVNAAICWKHGWTAKSAIGHKEWSDWKIDPGFEDMAQFRRDVQAAIDAGPKGAQPPPPPPTKFPALHDIQRELMRQRTALLAQYKLHPNMKGLSADITALSSVISHLFQLTH